jgi:hypothetical protein
VRYKIIYSGILGLAIVVWGGHFLYQLRTSYSAVASLCTKQMIGMTESELAQRSKQPGLRYTRFKVPSERAILIADLTPEGPDCRIAFDAGKVKSVIFDGNGYTP